MGSIWHIGVAVPDLQKGKKELVVFFLGSPAAVPFEVALAFDGVVNRFDPLTDPADRAVAGCLVAAVRAGQAGAEPGAEQVLEIPAGEALVPDQDQARPQRADAGGVCGQFGDGIALADLRAGQAPACR